MTDDPDVPAPAPPPVAPDAPDATIAMPPVKGPPPADDGSGVGSGDTVAMPPVPVAAAKGDTVALPVVKGRPPAKGTVRAKGRPRPQGKPRAKDDTAVTMAVPAVASPAPSPKPPSSEAKPKDDIAATEALPAVGESDDGARVFVPAPGAAATGTGARPAGRERRARTPTRSRSGSRSGRVRAVRPRSDRGVEPTPAFGALGAVPTDWRLATPDWQPAHDLARRRPILRILLVVDILVAGFYGWWLLQPGRSANVGLYALLLAAELVNLVQALGFWWTLAHLRPPPRVPEAPAVPAADAAVDVLVPVVDQPLAVAEPAVAAAMALRGADVRVAVVDRGARPEIGAMARRLGAAHIAGVDLDAALSRLDAPFVAVLAADQVADPAFLEVALAHLHGNRGFVQTPRYAANRRRRGVAAASWAQQALLFGAVAVGRDALGAMFSCGTNVVFRREALDDVGGFSPGHPGQAPEPVDAAEPADVGLSVRLHGRGWAGRYVPEVLASGLGPESVDAYVAQQLSWARSFRAAMPGVVRGGRLPLRLRVQHLLAGAYWLTGWTLAAYMLLSVVALVFGAAPVSATSPGDLLLHWGPYAAAGLLTLAVATGARHRVAGLALLVSTYWVHVVASIPPLERRVAPDGRPARPALVPLGTAAVLVASAAAGLLLRERTGAVLVAAGFALAFAVLLLLGVAPALRNLVRNRPQRAEQVQVS